MSADKKIDRDKLPRPEKEDVRHKSQEEYDNKKASDTKQSGKKKKVDWVVKDLPIY